MSVPVDALAKIDFQILSFVKEKGDATKSEILKEFAKKHNSVEFHLEKLAKSEMFRFEGGADIYYTKPNTSYLELHLRESEYVYSITPLGLNTLDYYIDRKKSKIIWKVIVPIAIPSITFVLDSLHNQYVISAFKTLWRIITKK